MTEKEKEELLKLYENAESKYRSYQYAKEMAEKYKKEYFDSVFKLPIFGKNGLIFGGLKHENK